MSLFDSPVQSSPVQCVTQPSLDLDHPGLGSLAGLRNKKAKTGQKLLHMLLDIYSFGDFFCAHFALIVPKNKEEAQQGSSIYITLKQRLQKTYLLEMWRKPTFF